MSEPIQVLNIHFDVPEHFIRIDDFIIAAKTARAITHNIDQVLFDNKLNYEIVILPPHEGSLLERIGVKIIGGAFLFMAGNMAPEFSSGIIKGLTGKSVFEYGQTIGEAITKESEPVFIQPDQAGLILTDAARGFLKTDTNTLNNFNINLSNFEPAFKARNEFYQSLYNNEKISGIGFSNESDFPIHRDEFPKYITEIIREEEDEAECWEWEIAEIKVLSPNWDKNDTRREWKARYDQHKEAYFTIEDNNFWGLFETDQLHLKGKDSIKVQWGYQRQGDKKKNFKVLKVLEYNGHRVAEPLSSKEIFDILFGCTKSEKDQGELFHK